MDFLSSSNHARLMAARRYDSSKEFRSNPCYILTMKIYVSHSKEFDFINKLYKPIRESMLNRNHRFFLPHEHTQEIKTQNIIKGSGLILAEVSHASTDQGIELGWANIFGVPIICAAKQDHRICDSLKHISDKFITYSDPNDLMKQLTSFLES